jgi:hypothetical protein
VKREEKSGNGGVQHDADHEWITFSRVMSKQSILIRNATQKSAIEQQFTPYGLAAHGMGTGGRHQQGGRPPACDLCDGFKFPHESDANSPCDVFAFSVSQHRAKEILDDPPLKAFIDRARKRYGKALINYPQPTEVQKQKLESRTTPTGRRSSPRKGRVAREEALRLDALQQPAHIARHRQRSNSSSMRGWRGSRKCAENLESQLPSKSREVKIRVSHVKCKSE